MSYQQLIKTLVAAAPAVGLMWGFAEGTLFFVVPDVFISFVALFSLQNFLICSATALVGSSAGGLLIYLLSLYHPVETTAVIHHVPFVTQKMFAHVQSDYAQNGLRTLLYAPTSGIPYKVYACLAPDNLKLTPFLWASALPRFLRFLIVGGVSYLIGNLFARTTHHPRNLLMTFVIFWCVFYLIYWYGVLT